MIDLHTDVLIVGGGGAGLTASMLLSRLGVDSLLVTSLPSTSVLPKAHVLHQRTMEILADLGIADVIYQRGTPPEHMRYSGWYAGLTGPDPDYGRRFGLIESWGCGGLSPDWSAASPQRQTNLPQIRLEPILLLPHTVGGATMVPMGPDHWGPDTEEWVVHVTYAADDPRNPDNDEVIDDLRNGPGTGQPSLTIHLITRWSLEGVVASRFRDSRVFLPGDAAHRHPPTGGLGVNVAIQDAGNLTWELAAVLRGHAAHRHRARGRRRHQLAAHPPIVQRPTRRCRVRSRDPAAIASQSMEFNELNIEYGYTYSSAAVLPDGSPEPENPDPIRLYQPSARSGHPLPHAWFEDEGGNRRSVHNLLEAGRFLLIVGEQGQSWCEAAAKLSDAWPIDAVRIGHLDGDVLDVRSTWIRYRGHGPVGAVLVRPDRVVAWRAQESDDPLADLTQALQTILSGSVIR